MLGDLLRRAAAREPGAIAFVQGTRRLTYREWDALSDAAAGRLWSLGARKGDVVALHMHPAIAYPVTFLGAAKIGAVTAGINPRLGPREVGHILAAARPVLFVTDHPAPPGARTVAPEELLRDAERPPDVEVGARDPLAIVFTSGTTGLPRGATYTAGGLEAVRRIEAAFEPVDHPTGIQAIPLAHVGFMTKIAVFIERVSTAVLLERWSARASLETIERERVTSIGGIPTQLALMLMDPRFGEFDLSSLRSCTLGGAPASPELIGRIRERFGVPVLVRYSCTELALVTGTRTTDPDRVVARTVGRPLPEVDLQILSPQPDGVGEVAARSPAMMAGYWNDPEGTRAALDEHGWFCTGDLGAIDPDGNLVLAGRSKEMYVRGGYNVYPLEVETVLREHPDVEAAAVVGVPDDVLGERGRAFVVPRDPECPPTAEALRAFVSERIADYKAPDEVQIRDSLPLTAMYKIDKRALADEGGRVPG